MAWPSGGAGAQGVLIDRSEIPLRGEADGRWTSRAASASGRPTSISARMIWRTSKAAFEIELASIDLASEETETEIRRPSWFDTAKFPLATFESTSGAGLGSDRYEIDGRLSMKGVTRDVSVPGRAARRMLRRQQRRRRPVHGQAPRLSRSAKACGRIRDTVADEVAIRVRMAAAARCNNGVGRRHIAVPLPLPGNSSPLRNVFRRMARNGTACHVRTRRTRRTNRDARDDSGTRSLTAIACVAVIRRCVVRADGRALHRPTGSTPDRTRPPGSR